MTRGISDQSSKISVSHIMSQAEVGGVDKCVDYVTSHLCHRELSPEQIQEMVQSKGPMEPHQEYLEGPHQALSDYDRHSKELLLPKQSGQIEQSLPPSEQLPQQAESPQPTESPQPEIPQQTDQSLPQTKSSESEQRDHKKEWMLKHGVDPINPVLDDKARKSIVENRIEKFLSVVTTRAHLAPTSHSLLLHAEEPSSIAVPACEDEVLYLDPESDHLPPSKPTIPWNRHHERPANQPEAKRRVVIGASHVYPRINLDKVQSVVRQQRLGPLSNTNIRFIERVGPPRIVAGAIWRPRYLEGVDDKVWMRGVHDDVG